MTALILTALASAAGYVAYLRLAEKKASIKRATAIVAYYEEMTASGLRGISAG